MRKPHYAGRWLLFWGALALILSAGHELWTRYDTIKWTLDGLINLCAHEGIPLPRALSYFDPAMFLLMLYLLGLALLGLVSIAARNRPRAAYLLIPACFALGAACAPIQLTDLSALNMEAWFRLLPLGIIALGSLINLAQHHARRFKRREADDRSHGRNGANSRTAQLYRTRGA